VRLRLASAPLWSIEGCIALQQLDLKIVDPAQSAEDDMRLLRLYAEKGDEGAFSKLVSRHMGWVYSACCRGLKDRHLAEDAAQAVFLTLARRAKSISPKVRLSGWLFKTTRFAVADARKRETRHQRRQELAMALAAVLTQILLPTKNGGRMPAAELLMVGYGARHHIRRNNLQHLHQEIQLSKKRGSFTLEESLVTLIRNGDIEKEDAQLCAIHPDDLNILLKSYAAYS
jgi:RNA polymerase sigma factor (sigma-70 family)